MQNLELDLNLVDMQSWRASDFLLDDDVPFLSLLYYS